MKGIAGLAATTAALLMGASLTGPTAPVAGAPAAVPMAAALLSSVKCGAGGGAPDFNRDAYADLVVAAPGEDVGAGSVNVLYGGPNGMPSTTVANQSWSQDSPNVEGVAEPTDGFGMATTTGDFNNDGYSDLAVGVPQEDHNGPDTGRVNVIYGAKGGLSATATPNQIFGQGEDSVNDVAEDGDQFGYALTSGDINGDGYDDLVVGVPGENVRGGAIEVIFGSLNGLSATTVPDEFWSQNSSGMGSDQETGDQFGSSLATGDFNDDGFADVAVGVPEEDGAQTDEGAVHIIYGTEDGLSATTIPDLLITQAAADVAGDAEQSDQLGTSVVSGNFNGDRYCDLAAGVPQESVVLDNGSTVDNAGAVNVVYGSSRGLDIASTAYPANEIWTRNTAGVAGTPTANAEMGRSLAAGDINGDGNDDLAMGAPGDTVNGLSSAGSVTVIYGDSGGLWPLGTPKSQLWSQDTTDVQGNPERDDNFGYALAIGSYWGGPGAALAIGVSGEDTGTGWLEILYDWGSTGLDPVGYPAAWLAQGHSGIAGTAEVGDQFAATLS
jgi:hypothetical protein